MAKIKELSEEEIDDDEEEDDDMLPPSAKMVRLPFSFKQNGS